jgi:hypothetical protein
MHGVLARSYIPFPRAVLLGGVLLCTAAAVRTLPGGTVSGTHRARRAQDLAALPPPPPPMPPDMLFAVAPDLARLSLAAGLGALLPGGAGGAGAAAIGPKAGPLAGARARVGRGGRLVLDRRRAEDCRRFGGDAAPADEARSSFFSPVSGWPDPCGVCCSSALRRLGRVRLRGARVATLVICRARLAPGTIRCCGGSPGLSGGLCEGDVEGRGRRLVGRAAGWAARAGPTMRALANDMNWAQSAPSATCCGAGGAAAVGAAQPLCARAHSGRRRAARAVARPRARGQRGRPAPDAGRPARAGDRPYPALCLGACGSNAPHGSPAMANGARFCHAPGAVAKRGLAEEVLCNCAPAA